jgi:hypothetical protein
MKTSITFTFEDNNRVVTNGSIKRKQMLDIVALVSALFTAVSGCDRLIAVAMLADAVAGGVRDASSDPDRFAPSAIGPALDWPPNNPETN